MMTDTSFFGISREDLTPCVSCGKGLMHAGPIIYRVEIEQHVVDLDAVARHEGMRMQMGGSSLLADVFSVDSAYTKPMDRAKGLICAECFIRQPVCQAFKPKGDEGRR